MDSSTEKKLLNYVRGFVTVWSPIQGVLPLVLIMI